MIKPLPGYVLIEPITDDSKSGEIYLPETSKDKPSKGRVVALSPIIPIQGDALILDFKDGPTMPTRTSEYLEVGVGVIVFYKKWTNEEIEYEGKKYLFVKFDELLGVEE